MAAEDLIKNIASGAALTVEVAAMLLILMGAIEAIFRVVASTASRSSQQLQDRKLTWLYFASWLLLALEFELGADIIRTAIAPSWKDIGQLAAIATIRTVLNWFLERDLEKYTPNLRYVDKRS